jgi:hypothetical protein
MKKLLIQLSNETLRIQIEDNTSAEIKISEESEVETFKLTKPYASTSWSELNSSHREPDNSSFGYPDKLGHEEAVKDKQLESSSYNNASFVAQESSNRLRATTQANNCKKTSCNQIPASTTSDIDNPAPSIVLGTITGEMRRATRSELSERERERDRRKRPEAESKVAGKVDADFIGQRFCRLGSYISWQRKLDGHLTGSFQFIRRPIFWLRETL